MLAGTHAEAPVATVEVRALNTLMWAPARAMCPSFAKEIEQAHYLKQAPAHERGKAVRIELHCDAAGQPLTRRFDVAFVSENPQVV
jgi:hypothetical protein